MAEMVGTAFVLGFGLGYIACMVVVFVVRKHPKNTEKEQD